MSLLSGPRLVCLRLFASSASVNGLGGYPKFISEGLNDEYLPKWLQQAGYKTYYTGKLMNGHSKDNYDKPYAKYWDGNDFLIEPCD